MQDHNGLRAVFDLPMMKIPGVGPTAKVQNKIDARALLRALREACPAELGRPATVIERVNTMSAQGHAAQTMDALLRCFGTIEGVLECMGWPPEYVAPTTWKRHFGLIDADLKPTERKRKALECARRLYPACTDIGLAKHHNRAESVLIGRWLLKDRA